MKPSVAFAATVLCGVLAVIASPALASEDPQPSLNPQAEPAASPTEATPPRCAQLQIGLVDPIQQSTCSVQVVCDDGSKVSCMGNSTCTTGGQNNRCVYCDGVKKGCCTQTCCESCEKHYTTCIHNCGNPVPPCDFCEQAYTTCVGNCEGGCP